VTLITAHTSVQANNSGNSTRWHRRNPPPPLLPLLNARFAHPPHCATPSVFGTAIDALLLAPPLAEGLEPFLLTARVSVLADAVAAAALAGGWV